MRRCGGGRPSCWWTSSRTRNLSGGDPPPRHPKRWQDIEEILDAGIDVWTTVNIQHLESLNDVVAQITGVRQRETVPDRIFDAGGRGRAHRPAAGRPDRAAEGRQGLRSRRDRAPPSSDSSASRTSWRCANSRCGAWPIAWMPRCARRSDRSRARGPGSRGTASWSRSGRMQQSEQLVRAGKRMADALDADWSAVYVETPELLKLSEAERNRRIDLLRLAESLGAETVTLDGPDRRGGDLSNTRTRATRRACSWARRSAAAGAPGCGLRRRPRSCAARAIRRHDDRGVRGRGRRQARQPTRRGADDAQRRSAGTAIGWALLDDRHLHGGGLRDVSVLCADQHRDGVHARRHRRGPAARTTSRGASARSRTSPHSISSSCRRASRSR